MSLLTKLYVQKVGTLRREKIFYWNISSPKIKDNGIVSSVMFRMPIEMTNSLVRQILGQTGILKFYKEREKVICSDKIQSIEGLNLFEKETNEFLGNSIYGGQTRWATADNRPFPCLPIFEIESLTTNEFMPSCKLDEE